MAGVDTLNKVGGSEAFKQTFESFDNADRKSSREAHAATKLAKKSGSTQPQQPSFVTTDEGLEVPWADDKPFEELLGR
eukprot:SAG31_NODE_48_length_30945_cov_16.254263_18_plen_78_part_00